MTAEQWTIGRQTAGLTQVQAARALGISQPYLSQLERGSRVGGAALARKAASVYRLPPTALPLSDLPSALNADGLQNALAALGYPAFARVRSRRKMNPALVVLTALSQRDLDSRLIEALPWLMSVYTDLDWPWLRDRVKLRNLQNRLGYLLHLTLNVQQADVSKLENLSRWRRDLEDARLAREDTLCRDSMPQRERSWLRKHRPREAAHWNLLTSLTVEQLPYASK
ncbi:MAG TPA: helix-turn-helix transcriptional regulator [Bryobacteraceae bacterium]